MFFALKSMFWFVYFDVVQIIFKMFEKWSEYYKIMRSY